MGYIENCKWVAGLSNGESLVEGKGIVARIDGEDSPWHKLQKYIKENNLSINSFGIWVGDKHYNLPSVSPKFGGEIPVGYNYGRTGALDLATGEMIDGEHFIFVEAIYPSFRLQLWVNESDTNKVWTNIINANQS